MTWEWTTCLITVGALASDGGGRVQTGPFGSQLHAADYVDSGIPSVMPQNIGDNVIIEQGIARISLDDAQRLSKYLLREGDIVYSRRGDVEKRSYVTSREDGWLCGTGCLLIRFGPRAKCDPRFISYLLGTEACRAWVNQHAVGATMPNLNTSILSAMPLEIPDLAEQEAIAGVLGALDDKIAANTKLATLALELARNIFKSAVSGTEMSSSTFGDIAAVGGGGTPSTKDSSFWGGGVPWLTPTDVTALSGPYLESTSRTITGQGLLACSSPLYPIGSIMMTSRATIGAFAIAQMPTAVNQGFIVVNPIEPELQWWIFHEMQDRVEEFLTYANGATFLELSRGKFKQLRVRLPESVTAAAFQANAQALHSAARGALTENRSLANTRDTLLPLLMSGKLRVRDAEKQLEEVL